MNINDQLAARPVVPLVQAEDTATAVRTSRALCEGGLSVIEVVLRTDQALDCVRAIVDEVPGAIVGAGTVLNAAQAMASLDYGAAFVVSPGLDDGIIAVAKERGVPVYPGVMTPGEVQRAFNLGVEVVKFFPASIAGGIPALKALASVFGSMRFMPTGGVNPQNLSDFLAIPSVLACGGSWLTPQSAIAAGDYDAIAALAAEALDIAQNVAG